MKHPVCAALLAASAALGLSACVTDDGYGYGSVGYGSGYYGDPYWGWYDGFYYPGTGYYLYDNDGRRHRWSDSHRRYWEGRRGNHRSNRPNWSGFRNRDGQVGQQPGVTRPAAPEGRDRWRGGRSRDRRD